MEAGYIPSYCTACYREGRTGERFMEIVKSGELYKICEANALITLKEFIDDYGEDYIEHATKKNPVAVMGNGDVTGYVYIVKTHAL